MKKGIGILVLTGMLSFAGAFTVFAGWEQQADNSWKYKNDESGEYVTGQWIQSATETGLWYYIDETGVMATNTLVDDLYWVNENGEWREKSSGGTQASNGSQQQAQTPPSFSQSSGGDDITHLTGQDAQDMRNWYAERAARAAREGHY